MTIRVRLSALTAASAFALAGCSGGGGSDDEVADLSANKILAAAEKQVAQEKFVTVEGTGKDAAGSEMEMDLSYAGETASGSIGVDGMSIEVVKAGGKSYFKADKEFFQSTGAPAQATDVIGDKWVVIDPANPRFGKLGNFLDRKAFLDELLKVEGEVVKGEEKKVNGVDCVALTAKDGAIYFDKKDGKPVSVVTTEDGESTIDFSYGKIGKIEAPSADEIIDLAKPGR